MLEYENRNGCNVNWRWQQTGGGDTKEHRCISNKTRVLMATREAFEKKDNFVLLLFSFRLSALRTSMLSSHDAKLENDTFRYHDKCMKYMLSRLIAVI